MITNQVHNGIAHFWNKILQLLNVNQRRLREMVFRSRKWSKGRGLIKILKHAERICKEDESSFFFYPKPGHVLARKGDKNVDILMEYCIRTGLYILGMFCTKTFIILVKFKKYLQKIFKKYKKYFNWLLPAIILKKYLNIEIFLAAKEINRDSKNRNFS